MLVWTVDQARVLLLCCFIASFLSVVGCLFIFVTFALFRSRRKKTVQRLVFNLALCHFFMSLTWIITGPYGELAAKACAWVTPVRYYFFTATCLWACAIATEMFAMWRRAKQNQFGELVVPSTSSLSSEVYYHIVSWTIPVVIVLIGNVTTSADLTEHLCSYGTKRTNYWLYVLGSLIILSVVYCCAMYCIAIYKLSKVTTYDEAGTYKKLQAGKERRLKLQAAGYMVSALITWIPFVVLTILINLDDEPTTQLFVFAIIACCVLPLGGFMDAMIYGWDTKLWDALLACLFCKRRRSRKRGSVNQGSVLQRQGGSMQAEMSQEDTFLLDEESD